MSPDTLSVPLSLIFVSSATLTGLARSRLAPVTLMDSGAISTFATGLVRRSSAEMLASRSANSPSSNCQAGPASLADATAGVVAGGAGGADGADAAGGVGAAAGFGAAGALGTGAVAAGEAAGVAASFSKLIDPSGSNQVTSFTPVMLRDSLCACRGFKSKIVPFKVSCGTVIQSTSEFFGRTARSVSATFETSTFRSTSSFSENL